MSFGDHVQSFSFEFLRIPSSEIPLFTGLKCEHDQFFSDISTEMTSIRLGT